jgi:hypothetical protein
MQSDTKDCHIIMPSLNHNTLKISTCILFSLLFSLLEGFTSRLPQSTGWAKWRFHEFPDVKSRFPISLANPQLGHFSAVNALNWDSFRRIWFTWLRNIFWKPWSEFLCCGFFHCSSVQLCKNAINIWEEYLGKPKSLCLAFILRHPKEWSSEHLPTEGSESHEHDQ